MAFTSKDVMDLRQRTGAGMMDCKKALEDSNGNLDKAIEYLREKGIAKAAKKAGRIAAEGIVDSYIHMGGRIGVLLEVNCETDFVARGDEFKNLVHDIALQIASMNPEFLSIDSVPANKIENEKAIIAAQMNGDPEFKNKPAQVLENIIEGRIKKFYEENVLLEQKFFKDPTRKISQIITDAIAKIGENITVRRYVRYERGEGIEKKVDNFAEEINENLKKMKANKK